MLLIIAVAVALIMLSPILAMKPTATSTIENTGIIAVCPQNSTAFLIKSDDGYILIDTGSGIKGMENSLKELNINAADVKHILLTHTDYDHIASLPLFAHAAIYMSEDELRMLNGEIANGGKNNSLPEGTRKDAVIPLKDEFLLKLGGHEILCVKAPGHTAGSMAFLVDGDYFFTGDSFKVSGGTISLHPFTADSNAAKESIQKLYEIIKRTTLTLTSHYGYYESDSLKLE